MVENAELAVGTRLRSRRQEQGLSLRALAERSGLSINAISKIERGENSPTVSSLHRLATALDIPITGFFQERVEQTALFVKRELGLRAESNGVVMESLGSGRFNQQLVPFRMRIGPNVANADDPIAHSGEEFIYCLEGEIECVIGDRVYHLEPGDSLLFNATQHHAYRNLTATPATLVLICQTSHDPHHVQRLHIE
jgi:transcriptional regulator with XRE-family HTH domain